ncbi:PadR family transcriptional regulator [bacterium]|nr:PadR family transcriptional regulator [bacterium]
MQRAILTVPTLTRYCNELLILSIIGTGKKHGYDLARELEEQSDGFFGFNHGTLYPILHKLEKDGLIRGSWKQEGPRRKRKYYSLTAEGKKYRASLLQQWEGFFTHFRAIIGETAP